MKDERDEVDKIFIEKLEEVKKQIYERFNLGDYTELYCRIDTFQLADVMENFIDVCLEKYKLDPSHYITSAPLAWDAMLKMTKVEIELLTDPKEASKHIMYLDENALYTNALCEPLPLKGFRWLTPEEMMDDHSKIKSCTLKVDLEYLKELHDLHNDYPLAPESVMVNGLKKLIPNLCDKSGCVVHHRALKCYLNHGLKLTKIHSGISYEESAYMKRFIDINTEARKVAKNKFEKDFYKVMNNSVFGKTMENVRDRAKIKIVNGHHIDRLCKLISKPCYRGAFILGNSNLVSLKMGESTVTLNKPIFDGQCTLDISKVTMFDYHYGYMKPKYGEKASVNCTDTDSLIYEIRTEDFYEDIREDVPKMFDTSAYPDNYPSGIPKMNKKVPGMMKDEAARRITTEFVGRR